MTVDPAALGEDKVGEYKIIRVLLRGQSSEVLEALQDGTGKRVAIKMLMPSKAADAAERKAFEFEAKLGMSLRHPNLIQVFEYVKDKTHPYFVMEYFPSIHLRLAIARPEKYGIATDKVKRILETSGRAIAYLHDQGWTHRDIKPENVLVNKTLEVRVIDYALAKRVPSGLGKLVASKPPREGTLSYMSPEQIRREPPSFQADIYSFGVFCYEMATGRQPFRADSPGALLQMHLSSRPSPPAFHNKQVTPEFNDLVLSMIQKDPKLRPATMHDVLSRLKRMRVFSTDPAPTDSSAIF